MEDPNKPEETIGKILKDSDKQYTLDLEKEIAELKEKLKIAEEALERLSKIGATNDMNLIEPMMSVSLYVLTALKKIRSEK